MSLLNPFLKEKQNKKTELTDQDAAGNLQQAVTGTRSNLDLTSAHIPDTHPTKGS